MEPLEDNVNAKVLKLRCLVACMFLCNTPAWGVRMFSMEIYNYLIFSSNVNHIYTPAKGVILKTCDRTP